MRGRLLESISIDSASRFVRLLRDSSFSTVGSTPADEARGTWWCLPATAPETDRGACLPNTGQTTAVPKAAAAERSARSDIRPQRPAPSLAPSRPIINGTCVVLSTAG